MSRKSVSEIMLILLLIGTLTLAFNIQPAKATGTIHIRADGSIDPPTAPIQRNGDLYTLTENINDADGIVIERNNMTLDGADYTVKGTGVLGSAGIALGGNNVTIKNINVESFGCGLWLDTCSNNSIIGSNVSAQKIYGIALINSSHNIVSRNKMTNNGWDGLRLEYSTNNNISENYVESNGWYGICLVWSPNNTLSRNKMNYNEGNLGIFCHDADEAINLIDTTNLVNGKPVYYFINERDFVISPATYPQIGYLGLINCANVTVEGLTMTKNGQGLQLVSINNSRIINNNVVDNAWVGIYIRLSSNNTVWGNNCTNNGFSGIHISGSSNNSVFGNNIADTFTFDQGSIYDIYGWGVSLVNLSSNNSIYENRISRNYGGIWLYNCSSNNLIYHNNFINNTSQVRDESWYDPSVSPSVNSWDDNYPSGGNYWSDYVGNDTCSGPYQNETGSDGIGDTPYIIDENNRDNYPLMGPFSSLTMKGENITVFPTEDVNLTFENVTSQGLTTVNKTDIGPEPPLGFKLAEQYYDVKTSANYYGTIRIGITYDDSGMTQEEEEVLQLMQWNETSQQWINITTYVDTENNTIYGETSHFSVFALIAPLIHDIAVTKIILSKNVVGQGFTLQINITITNHGDFAEIFDFIIYANAIPIVSQAVSLTSGASTIFNFTWNTTDFAKSNYTIIAYATPVLGEEATEDNTLTSGWVMITIPGDVNGDFRCEGKDNALVAKAYDTRPGDLKWNPNADINGDGRVEGKDVGIIAKYYDTHYP